MELCKYQVLVLRPDISLRGSTFSIGKMLRLFHFVRRTETHFRIASLVLRRKVELERGVLKYLP